jgi:Na+/H+ antiporter NhaD/arsenite permease-like protein
MIIGVWSRIPYLRFAAHLMPVAIVGLGVVFIVIAVLYRRSLVPRPRPNDAEVNRAPRVARTGPYAALRRKAIVVTAVAIALFCLGCPIALIALAAAAVLLIGRTRPEKIYAEVDWPVLVMFVGLFIVVHAFQMQVVARWDVGRWHAIIDHPVGMLSVAAAAVSNVVSNVPAVLLFAPLVGAVAPASRETAWLALAMASTLAGNLTLLGSVANLIVVERAKREGVTIGFVDT